MPGRVTAEGLLGLVIVAFPAFFITYTCFPLFSDRIFKIGHLFTPYCEIRFDLLECPVMLMILILVIRV